MSKVIHMDADGVDLLDCGHFTSLPTTEIDFYPEGTEVDCPTCADLIEKDNEIQSLKDKLQRAEGKIEEMVEFQKKYMSFDLSKGDSERAKNYWRNHE